MKVLVIGSGGREHAICHSFRQSPSVTHLYCADGNAGIGMEAECVPIRTSDIAALREFATVNSIDLTFVGGEVPLALGVVDAFQEHGLNVIGPARAAARLESSKSFAKDFMARHGVPTAKFTTADSASFAVLELGSGDFGGPETPAVIKADGLAAGKGVVVARNRSEAIAGINELESLVGAAAANKIVLEECLFGREVSLLMFADGEDFVLMPPVRDHKRIGNNDTGPNTGGMGTFTDSSLLTSDDLQTIKDTIIGPTLRGCIMEGFPFRGILFLGLMMTAEGPKLLEYNVRFGDPEAQSILVRLETDLVDVCSSILHGTLSSLNIGWKPGASACVVLATEGYPANPRSGDPISGLGEAAAVSNVSIFHGGTSTSGPKAVEGDLSLTAPYITAGGRVLGVTATGGDLDSALRIAYEAASKISWPGMQYRQDIGK